MANLKPKLGTLFSAILILSPVAGLAATPAKLTGSIVGIVRDSGGIPQMGATVLLLNRYERIVHQALSNEKGVFGFDALLPDLYSVRVSLTSFVPAAKNKIAVQPGMQSLLYINMASLLSSIELVYAAPGQGALMSDDWRWTLKTATATRPVLRILPQTSDAPDMSDGSSISNPNEKQKTYNAIFSGTRGYVKVSAGDPGMLGDMNTQPDLGTAFALATSILGHNELQFSGNLGHSARTGIPTASFRTSYSRDGVGPEVSLTMRQVFLPARAGLAVASGQPDGVPAIRTMSVSLIDHIEVLEGLRFEYGMSLDAVSFIDRLNYFSPFARLTYDAGGFGTLIAAYSSGTPPAELLARTPDAEAAQQHRDLLALSLVPLVSLHDGRTAVQRTQNFELGYEKKAGTRTLNLTGYREIVSNGALTLSGPQDLLPEGDVLPDISSHSSVFNIGSYQRYGYAASITQSLGNRLEVNGSYGRGGAIAAAAEALEAGSPDELRSKLHTTQRSWAAVRASGVIPVTGTQISTSYQWMDYNTILPSHLYLTQRSYPEAGWNVHVRQPIPAIPGMIGRLEATADLRNLMAQGYLSVPTGDARRLLLVQSPRALRGGLSFIF